MIAGGIIFIGARFLFASRTAAAGYGVQAELSSAENPPRRPDAWLYAQGVRDIASGIFICILLVNRAPHLPGAFMAAASLIHVGDAVIVLRSGGTRATAFGIHGVTAELALGASAVLPVS